MPCSRQSSATGTPPSAWRKIARIWGSLYLDNLMKISSCNVPRKFYLSIPLMAGGITSYSEIGDRRRITHTYYAQMSAWPVERK